MRDDYVEYLHALASDMGCGLRLEPNLDGMMFVEFGYVEGPTPYASSRYTDQQAFAVGLHELGHFQYGHTQGRPPYGDQKFYFDNGVLKSEAQAWDYALQHFEQRQEPLEPETQGFMWSRCLNSYYSSALVTGNRPYRLMNGNRHHVEFIWDQPDELFQDVRTRMQVAA